jgi:CO/xanthine dehydrogenase FAD-binding subunit
MRFRRRIQSRRASNRATTPPHSALAISTLGARHWIRPRRCQLRRAGKAEHRRTAHNLSLGGTEAIRAHPIPNAGPDCPFGAAFARITRRRGVDLATVNLCCGIDAAGVTRFAFGAVSARPLLVQDADGILADTSALATAKAATLDALLSQASPITDVRGSAEFRMAMLRVLAQRTHRRAAERLADGAKHG